MTPSRYYLPIILLLVTATVLTAQSRWEPTNGPFGGYITRLAVDRTGFVYAGTAQGLYGSADNGRTWSAIEVGSAMPGFVDAIGIDSANNVYVYIYRVGDDPGTFQRSPDRGTSWTEIATPDVPRRMQAVAITPWGDLFAGFSTMWKSIDRGATWENSGTFGPDFIEVQSIGIGPDDVVYAGILGEGIYRSTDNGESWVYDSLDAFEVTSFVFSHGHVFASARDVYRRYDTGWRKMTPDSLDARIEDLAVGPDGTLYGAARGHVIVSKDDGMTWTRIAESIPPIEHGSVEIGMDGTLILGTHGAGIYRSTDDGESWERSSDGIRNSYLSSLLNAPDGSLLAGGISDLHRTTDNGITWTKIGKGLVNRDPLFHMDVTSMAIGQGGRLFATLMDDGLFRSDDNGTSWRLADSALPRDYPNLYYTVVTAPNGYVYAGAYGIYRSIDGGERFESRSAGITDSNIYAIAVDSSGGIVTATRGGIFLSTNNGESWISTGEEETRIDWLAVTPQGTIIGVGYYELWIGRRSGARILWSQPADTSIAKLSFLSVAISPRGEIMVGGRDGRTYLSRDEGATWTEAVTGLPDLDVTALVFTPDGRLYAGTSGSGVYTSGSISSIRTSGAARNDDALSIHAEPNPLAARTRIDFTLAARANVTLAIYTMEGEKIATLLSKECTEGTHTVVWDSSGYASGAYLCVVRTAGGAQISRLLIVR